MATPAFLRIGRHLLRAVLATVAVVALLALGYPLAGWIGSSIPGHKTLTTAQARADSVTIMVETNGTHTGIVVPVANAIKDWRESFPSAARPDSYGRYPTHLSIGWGEREVFLHVPT